VFETSVTLSVVLQKVSGTGFFPHVQSVPTQLGSIDRTIRRLRRLVGRDKMQCRKSRVK
jgi:hypothetical protein